MDSDTVGTSGQGSFEHLGGRHGGVYLGSRSLGFSKGSGANRWRFKGVRSRTFVFGALSSPYTDLCTLTYLGAASYLVRTKV